MKMKEQTHAENLIATMISSGLEVSKELANEIIQDRNTVPHLIDILRTNKYWASGKECDGWAPFHALHLLSAMKAHEAIPTILEVLTYKPDELGDWLTESIGTILANFGESAIDPLKQFIRDDRNDEYARSAAMSALVVIYVRNPENNKPLYAWFQEYLDYLVQEQDDFVSLFADDMLDLRDPSLKGKFIQLVEKNEVEFILDDIDCAYSDTEKLFHDKDPMEHFEEKNIQHLMEVNYPSKAKSQKVGRNDPCPCGSGKKYKKCCLV